MTRQRFGTIWASNALAFLPLLLLQGLVFPRLPFPGAHPFLLPLAVAMVSVREGASAGAGYGLFVGLFSVLLGEGPAMIFLFSLLGAVLGLIFRYGLQRDFWGCLLGSILALSLLDLLRMSALVIRDGASFFGLLSIALPELLWSILFFPLVFFLYYLASLSHRRRGGLPA